MQGISVVIPVHNAGIYLQAAVDSILHQTHTKLECLIIDDHSSDSAIANLATHDKRIKVINSNERGIVNALNTGIKQAQYDYIARMDADDIAHPHRLEQQLALLNNYKDIDICGCKVEMFSDEFEIAEGYQHYQEWINSLTSSKEIASSIFIESPIPHPSALMSKTTLDKLGNYQDSSWPEDYDLWLRAHIQGMKFAKPDDILLRWRDHPTRLSRQDKRYNKQHFINCKAHYFSKLYANRQCIIWGTGPTGLMLHDALIEENISITAFVDISKKIIGRTKRDKPVLSAYDLKPSNNLILTAVSARGARTDIDLFLQQHGFILGEDYLNMA